MFVKGSLKTENFNHLKTKTMKKNLFFLIPVLGLVFLLSACGKDDSPTPPPSSPQGTWVGTGQYGIGPGNPTYVFSVKFNAGGTVTIVGNNNVAIDNATGTWQMVQDSVKAFYKYANSSADYTLAAKYSANSNILVGNLGLGTATSGVGTFSITRQ